MSIYNPPSKKQGIFNPSNYGGLGAGGQITTDYLDANYLQFPVAQGNMTLVGTNILGDVTQQGEFITTEDITGETIKATSILVGTTNVITEIGTKQDSIQDGDLTIAKTDGLQTALDNKYDDTGGTIDGDVTITSDLVVGSTNIITEIGTKQDSIQDGDLTIAKTDGLQTALDNKYDDTGGTIDGDVTITGDLVVGTTNVITEIGTKQDSIQDGDLTIAKTDGLQTALNNKYDGTGGTIGGDVTITGDLVIGSTNVITEIGTKQDTINDGGLTIAKTDGLQTALDNKYDDTGGTIDGDVTITGDLVIGATNVITEIGTKQDTIQDGGLTIAKTDGLQTALNNKYDGTGGTIGGDVTITGDLVIGSTNVITELGTKQDTIQDGGLTIAKTDGLLEALNGKQPTIEDDDLTIARTDGLQTVLTSLNQKYIPYNPDSFGLKAVSSWTERTASSGLWSRVVYAPELNLFIAISENTFNETMMSSANGFDWDYVSGSPNFLYDIVWSEELSLFVVVSRTSPYLRTSSDGVTWTGRSVPTTESLRAIAWSPELGLFAVVSFKGDLITSPDGINWTSRTNPNVNAGYSMCWSKELAVFIVGYQNVLAISSNGIDWTSIDTFTGIWRSIAWSPKLGLFVAVSNSRSYIITSPDGLNWTEISVTSTYSGIVWSDIGIFVAVGTGGYTMYSNDGINWVENDDVMSGALQGVCWSDELGIFVVVGNDTVYTSTLKGRPPTMFNTFDSEFNSIDEDGTWNFNSLTISGDLIVGTTNIITEIGTKQDTINDGGLTIAKTDGLQTALNNKYDDTGGTIGGDVTINGDLVVGTTNIITEIGTKQDTIQDNGLTIAKTDGLQTALNNKYDDTGGTINGNVDISGDLVVGSTNVITEIGTKQDTIQDNGLTIAKTDGLQTALDNKYDDTGGTIGGNVDISGDLVVGTTNIIDEIGTKQDEITTSTDLSCNSLTTTGNIYVGGYLLAPNQVSFRAGRTTSLSTINTSIVLPFDNVIFNIGDAYDNSTYEFTAPVSGIYFFYSKFFTSGNSAYGVDFLLDDGSETDPVLYRLERPSAGEGGTTYLPSSFTTQLNSGDKVYMKRISGTINCPSYPYSQFGGHLLA